ncbi:ZnF_C2H2 [Parelaphostrongylus tenuis]|uniref:ZnF_C2H2 n=1 Tax=Parelaphostrongylus tenuis TaxID=148309 RepID=A0AAD5N6D6_PARTN|nr:ZnF_C2H2 [Parelaphostrongylus tenuis]
MIVHSEPSSVVDTGAAPSPSPSADLRPKSRGSEKSVSPDAQETPTLHESDQSFQDTLSSSATEVITCESGGEVKNLLTIKSDYEDALRPTKEILPILKSDRKAQDRYLCPDCPFMDTDELIFDLHREMHGGRTRPFACNLCNYSCFAPEALHWHLSLHLPVLLPVGAASQRKRGLGRRGFQPSDPIPFGAKHFACTQCSFRTVSETTFVQHRQQHAQHIQQRLVTQMKRAASQQEEDSKRSSKVKRVAKKSDKNHACIQCTFRCDTTVAYLRHLEMHSQNAFFKCRICNYSANTKNIVDYHEQNHHLGQSLTELRKSAILAPDIVQLDVTASSEERSRLGGQDLRCRRCHFSTLDLSAYTKHWEQNHNDTPEDRKVAGELRMNLVPPSSILTTA